MKKIIIFAFAIFLFSSCEKETVFLKEATIIGIDYSECMCCGGYFTVVENDTLLADFELPNDILESVLIQFPFECEIKYKSLSSCSRYNRIEITEIELH